MNTALTLLENLRQRHARMAELADALDWDALLDEWRQTAPHLAALQHSALDRLTGNDRRLAAAHIAELLVAEARIAARIQPWMEQARPLLEAFKNNPLGKHAHPGG